MRAALLIVGCAILITGCLMVAWGSGWGIIPALVGLYVVIPLAAGAATRAILVKQGGGTLTLTAASSHLGGTTVSAGTLFLRHAGATGSDDGQVIVQSGGTLRLDGGLATTAQQQITLAGAGVGAQLRSVRLDQAARC